MQTDHLVTSNQARRSIRSAAIREDPRFKVPACRNCNEGKGVRLRVPPSHEDQIPLLEAVTGGKYEVWRGDAESLQEVVK